MTTVNAIDGKLFSTLSKIDGVTLSTISAILGQTKAASGPLPTGVTNLELWLPASSILGLSDGQTITTNWPDSSGNARNATSVRGLGGAGDWPIWQATAGPNSTPRVKPYSAAGSLANAGWFTLPNFMTGFTSGDVFVVFQKITKFSANPAADAPMIGDWGATTGDLFTFTDNVIYDGTGTSVRKTTADPGNITTTSHVYEVRTASGAWSNYEDNTQLFTTATNTVSFNSAPLIAHTVTNGALYDGYISDIIFYSRVINDATERKPIVYAYLNNTYGFALPTS